MAGLLRNSVVLLRCFNTVKPLNIIRNTRNPWINQKRFFRSTVVVMLPGKVEDGEDPLSLNNKDWEKRLSSEQYYVCREKGTELPFSGSLLNNYEKGIYNCTCCGTPLFSSETKFDSRSGWPSFHAAIRSEGEGNVLLCHDNTLGMSRTEVVCKQCDAHLGHVFPDGPEPTGERFCINSVSLEFTPHEEGGS